MLKTVNKDYGEEENKSFNKIKCGDIAVQC